MCIHAHTQIYIYIYIQRERERERERETSGVLKNSTQPRVGCPEAIKHTN